MRKRVSAALLGVVLALGGRFGIGEAERVEPRGPIVLTANHTSGYFPIDPKMLAEAPPILALSLRKVSNPQKIAIDVFVYLSYRARSEPAQVKTILVGNVSLYPPDRPAGFLLRASEAFAKLKESDPNLSGVQLVVEMRRTRPAESWTGVAVTVAPPVWKTKPD